MIRNETSYCEKNFIKYRGVRSMDGSLNTSRTYHVSLRKYKNNDKNYNYNEKSVVTWIDGGEEILIQFSVTTGLFDVR